jgi:hypothetical protein
VRSISIIFYCSVEVVNANSGISSLRVFLVICFKFGGGKGGASFGGSGGEFSRSGGFGGKGFPGGGEFRFTGGGFPGGGGVGGEGFESIFADMMGGGGMFGGGGGGVGGGGQKKRPSKRFHGKGHENSQDTGSQEKRHDTGSQDKSHVTGSQDKSQDSGPPSKNDPSGLALLGQAKFPDAQAKHAWLILFYHRDMYDDDGGKTRQYVSMARQLSRGLLNKAKKRKNDMIFRVGAVDCGGDRGKAMIFCHSKLSLDGKGVELPVFATVLNGYVRLITGDAALRSAKTLHDRTTYELLRIEGLIMNVNSAKDVESSLLAYSPTPGHPGISILLLTDKSKTSPLYASLAYRHRHDGFAAFGESRGNNFEFRNKNFSSKEYPVLLALIGDYERVEKYSGASFDCKGISKWLNDLARRYFKSES